MEVCFDLKDDEKNKMIDEKDISVDGQSRLVEQGRLIGVRLVSESHVNDRTCDISLGVVVAHKQNQFDLAFIRSEISRQLYTVPDSFSFLTSQGWPISRIQEDYINVDQITSDDGSFICIQRIYDQPRVGVATEDGRAFGFIFTSFTCFLTELRCSISDQLSGIKRFGGYQFVDRNGWPVASDQESKLQVIDILRNSVVHVKLKLPNNFIYPALTNNEQGATCMYHDTAIKTEYRRSISAVALSGKPSCVPHALTFQRSIDEYLPHVSSVVDGSKQRQILLSYVRAEAADHAIRLKSSLTSLGMSVFLDVHEIKSGVDWQDALNNAVSNCEFFVPLVTPRYGETQWTNREVKLADVLSKSILPVSFLDHWPPKCLAIQFATTQYILWKTNESNKSSRDIRFWSDSDLLGVAGHIVDRIKALAEKSKGEISRQLLAKRMSTLRSYPSILPTDFQILSQHRDGCPLVVVSLHPAQNEFGKRIQVLLETEGYEVWLSTQLLVDVKACEDEEDDSYDSCPKSQQDLFDCNSQTQVLNNDDEFGMCCDDDSKSGKIQSERLKRFQAKADEAGLIICILSKEFADSKMTREQVFYCEHRKCMVPVCYEDIQMPGWMSILIGTKVFEDAQKADFEESLKARIHRVFKNLADESKNEEEVSEVKLSADVLRLRQKMAQVSEMVTEANYLDTTDSGREPYEGRVISVYISGSTKLYCDISAAICSEIGKHLAAVEGMRLITGGFFGVGELVSDSYSNERAILNLPNNTWHVLPIRDSQDFRRKGRQNPDKTFNPVPYGKTIFVGDSVREREMITSRAFDVCIIVEGGPGAAHEVEQFAWNDHVVVPVRCTGGAAAGLFNVPDKIFEIPLGIEQEDWDRLGDASSSPSSIGESVARIICCIRDRLAIDSPVYAATSHTDFPFPGSKTSATDEPKSPKKKKVRWLMKDGNVEEEVDSN